MYFFLHLEHLLAMYNLGNMLSSMKKFNGVCVKFPIRTWPA